MELQVGVKVLLKNSEGKFLLLRRSETRYKDVPAKWDIVGGRIEPGKPLLENLKREVLEETGLEIKGGVKLVGAQDILRISGRHVVRITYLGEAEGEPVLSDEHTDFGWFTLEEMKKFSREELDIYFKELLDAGKFE